MNGTVNTGSVAQALGQSPKTVLERAKREGWPCVKKSSGIRWVEKMLPMDVRLAVENRPADNERQGGAVTANRDFYQATEKERQTAELRGTLIAEHHTSGLRKEEFIAAYNSRTESWLYKALGPVSLRTFYRWEGEFCRKGLGGLVPHYSAGSAGAGESLSDAEKSLLERFWLRDSRPTIQHAFRLLKENYPGSGPNPTYVLLRGGSPAARGRDEIRPPPHHRIGRGFLGCAALGGSNYDWLPTVLYTAGEGSGYGVFG